LFNGLACVITELINKKKINVMFFYEKFKRELKIMEFFYYRISVYNGIVVSRFERVMEL